MRPSTTKQSPARTLPDDVDAGMRSVRGVALGVCRRFGDRGGLDDLVADGNEALVTAFASFDATRGVPFACWATIRVRGAILDGVRREARWRRRHLADAELTRLLAGFATAAALPLVLDDRGLLHDVTPEDEVSHKELVTRARAAIRSLPSLEQRLVLHHYYDDLSLADAGAALGLSRSWASRLHARALSRIRRRMASAVPLGGQRRAA